MPPSPFKQKKGYEAKRTIWEEGRRWEKVLQLKLTYLSIKFFILPLNRLLSSRYIQKLLEAETYNLQR